MKCRNIQREVIVLFSHKHSRVLIDLSNVLTIYEEDVIINGWP